MDKEHLRKKTSLHLAAWLSMNAVLGLLLGLLLGGLYLGSVSREILKRYQAMAQNLGRACSHEMAVRGELGYLQQELSLSRSLEKQGVRQLMAVSESGLVLLHSDEGLVGQSESLTLMQKAALRGRSHWQLSGRGEEATLNCIMPLENYGQVWGALSVALVLEKSHIWPLRLGLASREGLWLGIFLTLLFLGLGNFFCLKKWLSLLKEGRKILEGSRERELEILGAGLAHEIKNSLNGVALNLQLLRDGIEDGAPKEGLLKKLERMEKETRSAGSLLSDFMDFSRPSGHEPKQVNVRALLKELELFFKEACAKEGIGFYLDMPENLPAIRIDEAALRQALTNLLWNALQATKEAAGNEMGLACRLAGGEIEFLVKDQGKGVPCELRERIFEPFFTTKKKGAGLGLALARKAARIHGGDLKLASSKEGAVFLMHFPCQKGGVA